MRWSKAVSEEMTKNNPDLVALKCVDCNEIYIIPKDVPLDQTQVPRDHVWVGSYTLRHRTYEDVREEQADREICRVCGIAHGPNPYTGCGLGLEGSD